MEASLNVKAQIYVTFVICTQTITLMAAQNGIFCIDKKVLRMFETNLERYLRIFSSKEKHTHIERKVCDELYLMIYFTQ